MIRSVSTGVHKDVSCDTTVGGCASKVVFLGKIQDINSIIMRTYSSIIFAIINTVTTIAAKKCILLSAHQENDR